MAVGLARHGRIRTWGRPAPSGCRRPDAGRAAASGVARQTRLDGLRPYERRLTVETDLEQQREARELALKAADWFHHNPSLTALDEGTESILGHDFGPSVDRVWYTQALDGDHVKFGYVLMRPGVSRYALAASSDFEMANGLHWVLCAVCDHPTRDDDPLAAHVHLDNLVHEATHCLDFRRTGHRPQPYQREDAADLRGRYYNTPHERNASFHQGLFSFLNDLELVKAHLALFKPSDTSGRRRVLLQALFGGAYWRGDFTAGLTARKRRRLRRRAFRLFAVLLPGV